ncbi:MAG: DUF4012 domain-containing protein, partial [Candidatus Chisholmbacteria bacterium]|nr:DUF4012 domain-containing protein [Candidatus Chisholmbacteria bacterium]
MSEIPKLPLDPATESPPPPPPPSPSSFPSQPKRKRSWLKILLLLLLFFLIAGLALTIPTLKTLAAARETLKLAKETYTLGKNQDLIAANQKLKDTKRELEQTKNQYQLLSWTKFIPLVGVYWQDGNRVLTASLAAAEAGEILGAAIEPYADVLGFKGQGSFMGGTAEDRIVAAVQTLDKVTPEIDQVAAKLKIVQDELAQVNPHRYPQSFRGQPIRDLIETAQKVSRDATLAVTQAKPVIELLPVAMGVTGERKYLILFQNDAELRATGGFMTAYGILRVDKGR